VTRFKAVPLTGYTITDQRFGESRKEGTDWYVLDSAYCYRIVKAFETGPMWSRGIRARNYAAALEQECAP
jgi:hypothetical protein